MDGKSMSFEDKSYEKHAAQASDTSVTLPAAIVTPHTVDAWRHRRMTNLLAPLIENSKETTWLTLGDARYGCDAYLLSQMGANATASNISDTLLEISSSLGHIAKYSEQNAERITYETNSFDYTLCKHSYHHFPRPPIAFYEMLRVAKQGVVLIEPLERSRRPLDFFREIVKRILRKGQNSQYESEGNYVYRTNVREVEKAMLALNFPTISYRYFSDFYVSRFNNGDATTNSIEILMTRFGIFVQEFLAKIGLMNPGLVCLVAFKVTPSDLTRRSLIRAGYHVKDLPRNPYAD